MVSQFCDFKYGFPHCIFVYRIRGPPELDAVALAASVMGMARSQTPKVGFYHGMLSRASLAAASWPITRKHGLFVRCFAGYM